MQTSSNTFKTTMLTLAMGMTAISIAHAGSDPEVEQLRQEVQELRALLQQYTAQQKIQNDQVQPSTQTDNSSTLPDMKVPKKGFTSLAGTEVNFYGIVRADGSYQMKGRNDGKPFNAIHNVPLENQAQSKDRFNSTLAVTRFGFDVKTTTQMGEVTGKIEADFLGGGNLGGSNTNNDNPRIRHAYLSFNDWLIGQTWSNFALPDYAPETVDANGYIGETVIKRVPQVRYTTNFSPATSFVVAVEDPKETTANLSSRFPAITARINQKFADDKGIVSARTMVTEKRTDIDNTTAWGFGLGAKYNLTPTTLLKADYYHVKGDNSFVYGSNQGVLISANKEILAKNEFDSITAGITQQFNSKWRGTFGYGYMKANKDNQYMNTLTTGNKELWQTWVNTFYSPLKPVSFGMEYVYGERKTFNTDTSDSQKGKDNRINVVASYNF